MRPKIDVGDRVGIAYESVQNGREHTVEGEVTSLTKSDGALLTFVLDVGEDNRYGDPLLRHVRVSGHGIETDIVRDSNNERKIGDLTGYWPAEEAEA